MTSGEQKRDFIFISDLIDVMLQFAKANIKRDRIFNVGFGKSVKIKTVATLIASRLNKLELLRIGALNYRTEEIMDYSTSIQLIQNSLEWKPKIELEEGLDITIQHYLKLL
jgi:nucleoside-diphosphate-sugar epimerase